MRIISFNANGIRATAKKGFFDWFAQQNADVICIQETKAQLPQLEDNPMFFPAGYHCHYFDAQKKGYSGTALYCRKEPDDIIRGMGHDEFDGEGRYIEARFGDLSIASLYAPSGSSGDHRQASKERYMDYFMPWLRERATTGAKNGQELIVCGDWNIAHQNRDLKNWKSNQKNSGFLPHEREWMTQLFTPLNEGGGGFVDAFREINDEDDQYTWWSNRGQAWANNVGWRIDYHVTTPNIAARATADAIYRAEKFSDHAPLILDYDLDL